MGKFRSQIIYVSSDDFAYLDEGTLAEIVEPEEYDPSPLVGRNGTNVLQLVVDEIYYPKVSPEISDKLGISRMAHMYVSDTQSDLRWRCAEIEVDMNPFGVDVSGYGTITNQYVISLTRWTLTKLMVLDTVPSSR